VLHSGWFQPYPQISDWIGKVCQEQKTPANLASLGMTKKTRFEHLLQAVDFNVFEGTKVHGAPEFVLAGGRVVVYEYELSPTSGRTSGRSKIVATPPFPSTLYDAVQDLVSHSFFVFWCHQFSSACHFIELPFCILDVLSICHFVSLPFY
jgi:hypothetical protein